MNMTRVTAPDSFSFSLGNPQSDEISASLLETKIVEKKN